MTGNIPTALEMTNELLTLLPDHERANGNKKYYELELAKEHKSQSSDQLLRGDDGFADDAPQMQQEKPYPGAYDVNERKLYEMLCRNEIERDPIEMAQLKCRYVTNKSPFLKIAPLKLEEANMKPYIVLYHDVLYDAEIELAKQMAKPRVSILFYPKPKIEK